MRYKETIKLALLALMIAPLPAIASAKIKVVATIKPLHSLVATLMQGVDTPHLLIETGSPHTYALKPSDARALQQAQLVFWVGPELETFLDEPLKTLATKARIVTLENAKGLTLLSFREGDNWEKHQHGDHHDEAGTEPHQQDEHETDQHLWLDPENAKALVSAIADALIAADPDNTKAYRANAATTLQNLDKLETELTTKLEPYKAEPFIVFHDAFHYFENRFGLNGVGSVTVSPERQPGAKHLTELKDKIKKLGVTCVFAEPQFKPKLVSVILEGTRAHAGTLDPIGAALPAGPRLYFQLLRANADAFAKCMSEKTAP